MRDPPRWKDADSEVDGELRSAMSDLARGDEAAEREALARLGVKLAAAALITAPASSAFGSAVIKVLLVTAFVGGVTSRAMTVSWEPPPPLAPAPIRRTPQREVVRYVRAEPAPPMIKAEPTPGTLSEEALLLLEVRRALKTDPEEAEGLMELHLSRYPQGSLQEEREVLAIEIARAKGEEVGERLRVFRARFPHSAHGRGKDP